MITVIVSHGPAALERRREPADGALQRVRALAMLAP